MCSQWRLRNWSKWSRAQGRGGGERGGVVKDLVYKEQGGGSSGSVLVECELGEVKREGVLCSGRGLGNRSLPL